MLSLLLALLATGLFVSCAFGAVLAVCYALLDTTSPPPYEVVTPLSQELRYEGEKPAWAPSRRLWVASRHVLLQPHSAVFSQPPQTGTYMRLDLRAAGRGATVRQSWKRLDPIRTVGGYDAPCDR